MSTSHIPQIKLIASDMDGTLLGSDSLITPENKQAILAAQRAGMIFAVCSGRFAEDISMILLNQGISCPLIGLNGCQIMLEPLGSLIHSVSMSKSEAEQIIALLESMGVNYYVFSQGFVAIRHEMHKHHSQLVHGDSEMEKRAAIRYANGLAACYHAIERPVYKFYLYGKDKPEQLEEVRQRLIEAGLNVSASSRENLEVMPRHVSKATGIKALADILDVPMSRVMTLGDEENDIPMLQCAGLGVAMANASDWVKSHAGMLTDSYDNDGVAKAIYKVMGLLSGQG